MLENIIAELYDNTFKYILIGEDPSYKYSPQNSAVFAYEDWYSHYIFKGILLDIGASGNLNTSLPQVQALLELMLLLKIEDALEAIINFNKGSAPSTTSITIPMIFEKIYFQVLLIYTPFLFSITDIDRLLIYLDNIANHLIQGDLSIPVARK